MRPQISKELEELIEDVAEENGFSSKSEFVRHATREYAIKLKND